MSNIFIIKSFDSESISHFK